MIVGLLGLLGMLFILLCLVNKIAKMQSKITKRSGELEQETFELQCWQAKLRRETEPTGIVEHELNGHHYIAVSHGLAEVPALYLSMRRMMMEVEKEKSHYSGKGGMLIVNGQSIPIKEWTTTSNQFKGKFFSCKGRYVGD